jgi:hypothetical protein
MGPWSDSSLVVPPRSSLHYLHVGYVTGSTLSCVGSKVGFGWLVNAYFSQYIHNTKEVVPQITKGSSPGMQGDGFASEPGEIMEVVVWLCVPLLLGL